GVFHTSSSGQPFVTPSAGRVDDIIRVVRSCPSGALSLSLRGPVHEDREIVDQDRKAQVRITRDGPYVVVGSVPLLDDAGEPVARQQGASLEHYALCRCGQSQNKPFCSGMHWYAGFTDPAAPQSPSLFEWAGGYPALLRTTTFFWEKHVPQDPVLAPLFAQMPPNLPVRLASWLSEVFGSRAVPEQAVLLRHALVCRLHRPRRAPVPVTLRVGRWLSGAPADDDLLLGEARPAGPGPGAALRPDAPEPPGAPRVVAQRGLR